MTKSKKLLLTALSVALVAVIAVFGTVAYLMDTDSDVNVMTLGNVQIVQNEQERGDDGLQAFTQDKPLYPAYYEGTSIPWAPTGEWVVEGKQAWKVVEDNANVVDKFVTVTNTGKSDAYVRTLIAYEGDETYGPEGTYIHIVTNGTNVDPKIPNNFVGYITVKGVTYTVIEYVYPEALAAGETSIPSLKQVYMDKAATNDVVAQYGEKYDILVLSQAVQTEGFENAATALATAFPYGADNANLVEWFENLAPKTTGAANVPPTFVDSAENVKDAFADSEDAFIVYTGSEDIVIDESTTVSGDVTIDFKNSDAELVVDEHLTVSGNLTITNANLNVSTDNWNEVEVGNGTLTLGEGTSLSVDGDNMPNGGVFRIWGDSKVVLDGAEIIGCDNKGQGVLFNVADGAEMVIEDGTVISGNTITGSSSGTRYALFNVNGTLIMNGGEITNNNFAHKTLISVERNGKFVINGGSITGNKYIGTGAASVIMLFMNAVVEMNDGTISNNDLGANSSSAVFLKNGTSCVVTLNGGTVVE